MNKNSVSPTWAPRIKQQKIKKLYENDTKGINDEELLNDVGITLLFRCESFILANEAVNGKAQCPICKYIITHYNRFLMLLIQKLAVEKIIHKEFRII